MRRRDAGPRIERGSRDHRLLPIAATLWTACLATNRLFVLLADASSGNDGETAWDILAESSWREPDALLIAVAMLLVACAAVWRISTALVHIGVGRTIVTACVTTALLGALTTWAVCATTWHDPAMARAREGSGYLSLEGTVVEPVLVSSNRKADCQAEMRVQILDDGLVRVRSNADVRLFASGDDCSRIHRGAVYRASGTFAEAVIGTTPLWLTVHGEDGLVVLKEQPWPERCREHMQESFFRATEGLSDQGRVLVPGLTMGFLGQDHPSSSYDARPINDTYASQLEERFRTAGIMHLMAVSGGHFVIVSGLIRRICARLLVPRRIVAVLMVGCTSLLAALMAPGDSVSRALVMGWIGAAALYLGRRTQALSALCVTVIVMLLLDPALAWSYGFALSCASVLGIVMMSRPISGVAALILPDRLADAVAMTIAAQTATLPIQVMMEPQLPLWSLVANVLVSPVVDFATMAGLAGLAVAWANVDAAAVLAWVASWGTRVMERVAMWLGGGEHAVVPWAGGVRGAILLAAIETAVILTIVRIARLAGPSRAEHALPGEPFTRNPRNRLRIWWDDTMRMMRDLDAYRE